MIAELSGSNMQPPDAQKIQSIIDELQLAARQYYLKKHEPPTAADTAVKHTQVAALFDLIMQELGMLKTLTTQVRPYFVRHTVRFLCCQAADSTLYCRPCSDNELTGQHVTHQILRETSDNKH